MRHDTEHNITTRAPNRFDRAYFDRWYRHPARRLKSPAELEREVEFVLRASEHVLGRPVRSVLDVGCGEGHWQPLLAARRPAIRYAGVDPSEYVVRRWGKRRNITLGSVDAIAGGPFDLIVCCGVLNYLSGATLTRGLAHIATALRGVAYLEMYTSGDTVTGDTRGAKRRSASWYRRAIRGSGLVPCGLHLYVSRATAEELATLERLPLQPSPRSRRGRSGKST